MSKLDELIEKLCPDGVKFYKMKEIANTSIGEFVHKNKQNDKFPYPVFNGGITNTGFYEEYNNDGKRVLISARGANAGFVNKIDGKYWAGNSCYSISVKNDKILNWNYLYYYMKNNQNTLLGQQQTGSIPSISKKQIEEFDVAVPPLEVQCEIVRILDDFTKISAELSAELKARQKQYEYYRNQLIKNCDGEDVKLIDLLSQPITDGPHTTPKLYPNGIPFISATAVYDGKIHLEDAKGFISKQFDEECAKKYKPQKHDVYMVKSGSTTGKVAYVDTDDNFNIWSPLAAMRTGNAVTSRYLYHLLQTTDIQNQVQARMSHGSQPNLSMRVLEQFDVKKPSMDEQKRIVDILDRLDIMCNDIFSGLPAEIEARQKQYEYYRDKLLTFKELKTDE